MFARRSARVALCSALAVVFILGSLPAQAAVADGSARGGAGGSSCNLTVSCSVFLSECDVNHPSNGVDASAVRAAVGGQSRKITWSLTAAVTWAPQHKLNVVPMNSACVPISSPVRVSSGQFMLFPAGTAYAVAWPVDAFVGLNWTIH